MKTKEPVTHEFELRYLVLFTKATPLSPTVTICITWDYPIVVDYPIDSFGYIRYYVAPTLESR